MRRTDFAVLMLAIFGGLIWLMMCGVNGTDVFPSHEHSCPRPQQEVPHE